MLFLPAALALFLSRSVNAIQISVLLIQVLWTGFAGHRQQKNFLHGNPPA
jgi:hypothetical protein